MRLSALTSLQVQTHAIFLLFRTRILDYCLRFNWEMIILLGWVQSYNRECTGGCACTQDYY